MNTCEGECYYCPGCQGYNQYFNSPLLALCGKMTDSALNECIRCTSQAQKVWTAIGCVPTDFSLLLRDYIFPIGIGVGGGIAFLFFIYGTFLILTSAGNAEQVEQGRQTIVSAISGLILIIFAVLFLKIIGVDILRIPELWDLNKPK